MVRLAAAALALAATLHGIATYGAEAEILMLDFWSPTCGPCMQMKPTVETLINARYPIRQVNVSQEQGLAQQFRVTGIPCFVMLVDGQEVDRVVGATSSERLQQMFSRANALVSQRQPKTPPAQVAEPPGRVRMNDPKTLPQLREPAEPAVSERQLSDGLNSKLLSCSVRLTAEDAQGRSHGTGTIIDAREGEALIITCGHLFRESKGQSPVKVELYESGPQGVRVSDTLQGRVVSYDLERDVAFVSIRPSRPVCVAAVAPERTNIAKGDLAASVGCSNGDDPTVMSTRITMLDRYQGPPNIEASGAPVEGRSGGGLFNEQGQLVGVCYAADYEGNRGLYAGLESIHEELARLGLKDVFAKSGAAALAGNTPNGLEPMAAGPIVRGQEPLAAGTPADLAAAPPVTASPPGDAASLPQNLSPTENAALEEILKRATKRNVVCIIQPETPGGAPEVITLENVSEDFVRALAERQKAAAATTIR
jgi:thiol-disulfide isomerase/thioredoxin